MRPAITPPAPFCSDGRVFPPPQPDAPVASSELPPPLPPSDASAGRSTAPAFALPFFTAPHVDRCDAVLVQPGTQVEAFVSFMNKATGWLFVAGGALLLAVDETWGLREREDWPSAVFWVVLVVLAFACAANTAVRMQAVLDTLQDLRHPNLATPTAHFPTGGYYYFDQVLPW